MTKPKVQTITNAARELVLCAISDGLSHAHAAAAAGLKSDELKALLKEDEAFAAEVRSAEADLARTYIGYIRRRAAGEPTPKAAAGQKKVVPDWRAAAWYLERRFPKQYGSDAGTERTPAPPEKPFSPWKQPAAASGTGQGTMQ